MEGVFAYQSIKKGFCLQETFKDFGKKSDYLKPYNYLLTLRTAASIWTEPKLRG